MRPQQPQQLPQPQPAPSIPTPAAPSETRAQLERIGQNNWTIHTLVESAKVAQRRLRTGARPPPAVAENFRDLTAIFNEAQDMETSLHDENIAASRQGATLDPSRLQRDVETTQAMLLKAELLLRRLLRHVKAHLDETTIDADEPADVDAFPRSQQVLQPTPIQNPTQNLNPTSGARTRSAISQEEMINEIVLLFRETLRRLGLTVNEASRGS